MPNDIIELTILDRITSFSFLKRQPGVSKWDKEATNFLGQAVCLSGVVEGIHRCYFSSDSSTVNSDHFTAVMDNLNVIEALMSHLRYWCTVMSSSKHHETFHGLNHLMQLIARWVEVSTSNYSVSSFIVVLD